ncbi:PIG-L family deacetylase [Methanolobus sediminis]|uniref:PIG-L family deacetylase n=1 Tax=Methanolobus sediminis TaxID=3072978 RepID=A0AA51UKW0_9EURY|nr:PIG-L family deacetylase [Methanolobus sediminis]WMW25434.1 PIG-L family deacetylase [Methanolobus sediminis]
MVRKILAMGAHPDDMELEAGGTLAKFSENGDEVYMLILTSGGYTDSAGSMHKDSTLHDEAELASKILGVKELIILDYKTTRLSVNSGVVSEVDDLIDRIKPDILISHHPFDSHQDHKTAAEVMAAAARQGRVKNVLSGSPLPYRPNIFAFKPQFFVDITSTIDKKADCIRAYNSQYTKFGGEKLIERVKAMAKFYGWAMGYEYAECFEVIRIDDSLMGFFK